MLNCDVRNGLQELRHELVWRNAPIRDYFHATEDKQVIRDAVFARLQDYQFKIQATVCEKSKAQPQVRRTKARFYKYPWFYHFKHGIRPYIRKNMSLIVTAASIGNRKEKLAFCNSSNDVLSQFMRPGTWAFDFRPSIADPCLQVADYCGWAIQRQWESGDDRSYRLIRDRVTYEYELWRRGTVHYY
jgi:hypothetical protein